MLLVAEQGKSFGGTLSDGVGEAALCSGDELRVENERGHADHDAERRAELVAHVADEFRAQARGFDRRVARHLQHAFGLFALGDIFGNRQKKSRVSPIIGDRNFLGVQNPLFFSGDGETLFLGDRSAGFHLRQESSRSFLNRRPPRFSFRLQIELVCVVKVLRAGAPPFFGGFVGQRKSQIGRFLHQDHVRDSRDDGMQKSLRALRGTFGVKALCGFQLRSKAEHPGQQAPAWPAS